LAEDRRWVAQVEVTRKLAWVGIACVALGATLGATGCLGGDDTAAPPGQDAGRFDSAVPTFDSAVPDVSAPDTSVDAGVDAADATPDGNEPTDATPIDTGVDAPPAEGGITGKGGLVSGGSVSRSPNYVLTGTAAPATGTVQRSTKYQLVGGMAVTTQ
jgi:hypothetical protein